MAEPLLKTARVRCGIAHAFETFTKRIDLWWPRSHRRFPESQLFLEDYAGGRFYERAPSGEENELGVVLSCDPPQTIRFTWRPGAISLPTEVNIHFVSEGDETVITVRHTEGQADLGDQWPSRVALFQKGWDAVLAAWASHLRSVR